MCTIRIRRQFKEFVRHDISLGFCATHRTVKVTAQQYWPLPYHRFVTYVIQSAEQHCRHFCQHIVYACKGGRRTARVNCVMSSSGSLVYSPYIQLQFLEGLFFTDFCNLLPVLTYVAFRHLLPSEATMRDMKKALRDNNMEFNQLKDWNPKRCQGLLLGWWTRDEYGIGLLVEGTQCSVVWFHGCLCQWRSAVR
jgi:hypothetical protein